MRERNFLFPALDEIRSKIHNAPIEIVWRIEFYVDSQHAKPVVQKKGV